MKNIIVIVFLLISFVTYGQIGYQVSLINNATGEARANEKVEVKVELTYDGGTLLSETVSATTNDFGVLSLTVGNSSTFDNFDWSKLPLYISATVDGTLIGKSQVLTVPVAEHAKHTGTLTKEILCSKRWECRNEDGCFFTLSFKTDGTVHATHEHDDGYHAYSMYRYYVSGDFVCVLEEDNNVSELHYYPELGSLIGDRYYYK